MLRAPQPETSDRSSSDVGEMFARYRRTRDRALRNRLVTEHLWLARKCAGRFRGRGEDIEDLYQVAQIGVIKAVERFDPERGVGFVGFASPTVMGELKRHFRDTTWAVSVPRRTKELLPRVSRATETLHQRLGRSPTPGQIAELTGLDRDAVLETLHANDVYRSVPLDRGARATDGLDGVQGVQGARSESALDELEVRMHALSAVGLLGDRSRQIIYWRFYEELTQREIGERLGIGQVHVSRLLRAALIELRSHLDDVETVLAADGPRSPVAGHRGRQRDVPRSRPAG